MEGLRPSLRQARLEWSLAPGSPAETGARGAARRWGGRLGVRPVPAALPYSATQPCVVQTYL